VSIERVNWFSPIAANTGYAVFGRELAKAIDRAGVEVSLFPNEPLMDGPWIDEQVAAMLKRADSADLGGVSVNLSVGAPRWMAQFGGRVRIGYTMLETSRIPDDWVKSLNQLDGVWTPSAWGKKVFADCGVKKDSIAVVPGGVDPVLYDRKRWIGKLQWPEKYADHYKFLCVGKWEVRKMQRELAQAFVTEFEGQKALLVLACHNPFIKDFNAHELLFRAGVSIGTDKQPAIEVVPANLPLDAMAALYANVDAFVLPTRGEGFGLPILEAMASGLPVITTQWGGQSEYLTGNGFGSYYPIELNGLIPVDDPMFFRFTNGSKWSDPDIGSLRDKMRAVFDGPETAKDEGLAAAKYVRENWTWDHAAAKAIKELERWT